MHGNATRVPHILVKHQLQKAHVVVGQRVLERTLLTESFLCCWHKLTQNSSNVLGGEIHKSWNLTTVDLLWNTLIGILHSGGALIPDFRCSLYFSLPSH